MADLALLVLTLLWGTTFLFVHRALEGTSPAMFLVLRFAVATLGAGAVWLLRRDKPSPGLARHGALLGLAMFGGFALQTEGLRLTTPSRSAFLTGLSVLVVPCISRFVLRRAVGAPAWAGVGLALAGSAILTRPFSDEIAATMLLGDALTFGCALCFGLQIVMTAEWSARHPLALLTLIQIAVTFAGALLLLPIEPLRITPTPWLWMVVVFTGLFMTTGAFFVQNWGQRHTSAVRVALIFSLEPVAAALFAHFYGGDALAAADWIGGGLIVVGVIVAEAGSAFSSSSRTLGAPSGSEAPPPS